MEKMECQNAILKKGLLETIHEKNLLEKRIENLERSSNETVHTTSKHENVSHKD